MDIFQMTPKVTALCEILHTDGALEWPFACVFAEVISQITAFLEDALAVPEAALEKELNALCSWVSNLHRFMPCCWNSFKCFRINIIGFSCFRLRVKVDIF
jgi:hypothetical protein